MDFVGTPPAWACMWAFGGSLGSILSVACSWIHAGAGHVDNHQVGLLTRSSLDHACVCFVLVCAMLGTGKEVPVSRRQQLVDMAPVLRILGLALAALPATLAFHIPIRTAVTPARAPLACPSRISKFSLASAVAPE